MKIIAQMITAASVVFGIKRNVLVKNPNDNKTRAPVTMPPRVVRTPLALLTAVRVNDPVTGIDCTNEPSRLHIPSASISCVASIVLPLAGMWHLKIYKFQFKLPSFKVIQFHYSQNALATAILSRIEINGIAMIEEPTCVIMSVK